MEISSLHQTIRSCKAHGHHLIQRPGSCRALVIEECKQLWDFGRLSSCCCGGTGLTTPGNCQRKPPGWAPRVCKMAWAQHREVFSCDLGRLLALSRPPGSPSISPIEWRGRVWGEEIYFLSLEPAILPAPTFLLAREQWGISKQAFLGQQVHGAGAG